MCLTLCLTLAVVAEDENTKISVFDMLPVISFIKSAVQLIGNDKDGAAKTMDNFWNKGMITSQARSLYFLVTGDPGKAGDIQLEFLGNLEPVVDSVPGVGHAKGLFHLITNESERGLQAIKSATSSTGAVIGAVLAGPGGAVGGHVLTDLVITAVDTTVHDKLQTHGTMEYIQNFGKKDIGGHFDAVTGLVLEAAGAKVSNAKKMTRGKGKAAGSAEEIPMATFRHQGPDAVDTRAVAETAFGEAIGVVEPPSAGVLGKTSKQKPSDGYQFVSNSLTNRIKQLQFDSFVRRDEAYKNLYLAHPDKMTKYWTSSSLDELRPYLRESVIDNLDLQVLTNKLKYLSTGEHYSLIERSDFRLINTVPKEPNSIGCAVGGILGMDIAKLKNFFYKMMPEVKLPLTEPLLDHMLDVCQLKRVLTYERSGVLNTLYDLDLYLKTKFYDLENKHLILSKTVSTTKTEVSVLKYTLSKDGRSPIKLLVDYEAPPMVTPELPNPYRFQNFIDEKKYKSYELYITKLNNEENYYI